MKAKEHPLYAAYHSMKNRCYVKTNRQYADYGGRGITVCDRWMISFWNFLADMGEKPTPFHTLERKDNDGHYTPENCKWATRKEQQRNRRYKVMVTIEGKEYRAIDLSDQTGMKSDTIVARAAKGLTLAEVLSPEPRRDLSGLSMSPNSRSNTHCRHGHEYTPENTYWTPAGFRQCRICNRANEDRRRVGGDRPRPSQWKKPLVEIAPAEVDEMLKDLEK